MDRPFLKLMSEAYVSDTIDIKVNSSEVYEYITTAFDAFRNKFVDYTQELYQKPRSYQQDLIYSILDFKFNPAVLEETEETLLITEIGLRSFSDIAKQFKTIFFDSNLSPEMEFLQGVIEKNHNNCNRTCVPGNVAINDNQLISLIQTNGKFEEERTFNNIFGGLLRRNRQQPPEPKTIYKISKCLRLCYLDYLTSVYAEGTINYNKCINELDSKNTSYSLNSYTDILKNHPLSDDCAHIFSYLNELYSTINKLLTIVYNNDSIRKRKWLEVIDEKLRAFRSGKQYIIDFSKIDDEYENPNDFVRVV